MHILVVMDPIEKLDLPKDTSVGFILAAFRRNWAVSVCSVGELYSLHNQVCTVSHSVEADREHTLKVVSQSSGPLAEFDAVLMRVDPPVNREYLHATHLLDLAERDTLVLNNPRGIRFANEKAYALHFPDLTPYTRLSSSPKQVRSWLEEGDAPLIVKPVDGHGGSGVFLLANDDRNVGSILESLTEDGRRMIVVQQYLEAAREGDKRVIMIDGEPKGAILRVPRADDHRGNIHVGGTVVETQLTKRDLEICNAVGPRLREDGLSFVGLDIIGEYLTEINVTSPTGIREFKEITGVDLAEDFLDLIARLVAGKAT